MPKRVLRGVVVGDKQEKTITVLVERKVMHPVYKKYVNKSKKYAVHDNDNKFKTGDKVTIRERDSMKQERIEMKKIITN